jgi:hypothetical protein
MMGSLTSNWKQLNSALREDSDVPDLWVPWQDKTSKNLPYIPYTFAFYFSNLVLFRHH